VVNREGLLVPLLANADFERRSEIISVKISVSNSSYFLEAKRQHRVYGPLALGWRRTVRHVVLLFRSVPLGRRVLRFSMSVSQSKESEGVFVCGVQLFNGSASQREQT
jgi:hypothetical protein